MEIVRYKELAEYLRTGREIEFVYNEKQFSITNAGGFWSFYCDTDGTPLVQICPFGERDLLAKRTAGIEIGGRPLEEVFDLLLYDQDSLYVL